jgi:NAD(P)H dehydrogenase (quinone)
VTVAVSAASGRLGHAILRELVRHGQVRDVVAVARQPDRVRVPDIDVRPGDYESPDAMAAALGGIETLIMISAPVAGGSDRVRLHRNAIAAAREAGVRRVLYTSVIGNGLEMDTLFGATQQINRQTEADLAASGLEWVIGRNALYLDLDLIQMRKAAGTGVYANPAGTGRCPYLSIEEIAYAWARLAADERQTGQTYNISGDAMVQAEILRETCEVFGLQVRYEAISDEACIGKFRALMPERGEAVARMLTGCFQAIRAGAFDVPSHFSAAAGRPAKSLRVMLEELKAGLNGAALPRG